MKKQKDSTESNLQFLKQMKKSVEKSTALGNAPLCMIDSKYSKNKSSNKVIVFDNVSEIN